jgi:hypothetical protein
MTVKHFIVEVVQSVATDFTILSLPDSDFIGFI